MGVRPRTVMMVIGIVVATVLAIWLLWLSRRIVSWVLISVFLTVALNPVVELIQRRLRFRRVPAVALTFFVGLLVATGIVILLVPPLIDAGQQLAEDAPGYVDELRDTRLFRELDQRYDVVDRLKEQVNKLPDRLGDTAVEVVQRVATGIIGTVTVLVLTFLLLIYGKQLRDQAIGALPERHRRRYLAVTDRMYKSIGGYVAGNLLVSLIAGVAAFIILRILGIPAAAALAFWVAITDLIPLVGATIGAIPAVIVAFFQSWPIGVGVLGYFLVYQQVENHFVQPLVMRRTTSLNPLIVLVAVLLGAELLGIFGALIAIPVAGIVQILAQDWIAHRWPGRGGKPAIDLEPAPPDSASPP